MRQRWNGVSIALKYCRTLLHAFIAGENIIQTITQWSAVSAWPKFSFLNIKKLIRALKEHLHLGDLSSSPTSGRMWKVYWRPRTAILQISSDGKFHPDAELWLARGSCYVDLAFQNNPVGEGYSESCQVFHRFYTNTLSNFNCSRAGVAVDKPLKPTVINFRRCFL